MQFIKWAVDITPVVALTLLSACGAASPAASTASDESTLPFVETTGIPSLEVRLPDLEQEGRIPMVNVFSGFGCTGQNQPLRVEWSNVPQGTQSFAVIVHDPDAPTGVGFFHWSVFNIPASVTALNGALPEGAVEGYTDFGTSGYGGPCPPPGAPHRYVVTVYALDTATLGPDASATGALLRFMLREHTLAFGRAIGVYGR